MVCKIDEPLKQFFGSLKISLLLKYLGDSRIIYEYARTADWKYANKCP